MTFYDPSLSRDAHSGSWYETVFGSLHRGLNRLESYLHQWQYAREQREAFKTLLMLDQRMLDDIGLTREDIEWASRLPLHINAAEALRHMNEERGL